jgi:TolA-binding protein
MRNFFIGLILLIVAVKYGATYMLSDGFQEYANRTKAPWTCQFENSMGHLEMLMSDYKTAEIYFTHTLNRCKDPEMTQVAEFEMARAAEGLGQIPEATRRYMEFAEKYPKTKRAKIATRAADLIRIN